MVLDEHIGRRINSVVQGERQEVWTSNGREGKYDKNSENSNTLVAAWPCRCSCKGNMKLQDTRAGSTSYASAGCIDVMTHQRMGTVCTRPTKHQSTGSCLKFMQIIH